eukprot:XP_011665696.1 PREDICTED: uncharacterized protein LOC105438970 [Strongylocentrotus purpuratus]
MTCRVGSFYKTYQRKEQWEQMLYTDKKPNRTDRPSTIRELQDDPVRAGKPATIMSDGAQRNWSGGGTRHKKNNVQLSAERVTSQSYEGLLSSLPGLEVVDITIGDARAEDISQIQTSLRRYLAEQDLTRIDLSSLQSEENVSSMSRMRMEGLGLLITECQAMLSGILFGPENAVIDLVQSSMRLMSASLFIEQFLGSLNSDKHALNIDMLNIMDCQLSTEMTEKFWSYLRSFTSLNHLTISDSSLICPSQLKGFSRWWDVEGVMGYEGLLSSLPGLRRIGITIDDAERDVAQMTACLRRTRGQQLTHIDLTASDSLPSEKKSVSRETIRGLGLLIREQTKHLQRLNLSGMKCLDEEDLLPSVTELSAEKVTSQSYEGLLSSLPGLREIYITIDDAERDIAQITAGIRRTGGQQLTHIDLTAPSSLPSEKKSVSRETIRGLGLLIREQTKNLQLLNPSGMKCLDEEDLVELVESSTYSKALIAIDKRDWKCYEEGYVERLDEL